MTETNNKLPDWIERQATLGPNVKVDGQRTEDNFFWYFLTVCCPLIFESYAIILHPFWINWKANDLVLSGLTLTDKQVDGHEFSRVNWPDFFRLYGHNFSLDTANQTQEIIRKSLLNGGTKQVDWPVYIWFPCEGNCETAELKYIFSSLTDLYGNLSANFYYNLLKTQEWTEDKIYNGKLSEFDKLVALDSLRDNPTAVFPDDKTWCLVSDYDLSFTYIGGTKEFINRLTTNKDFDIYEIEPKYNEKKNDHTSH
jgi:hypothetical protein